MEKNNVRPVSPVKPKAVDLVFIYPCPFCGRELPMIAPTRAAIVQCDVCERQFPLVPVEERTVAFIKIMLGNGAAAIDADYM